MAQRGDVENIKIEPVWLTWGFKGLDKICAVADVTSSLLDTYFTFEGVSETGVVTPYYAWMNVGAAGTDPLISGKTGVEIAFAADASATVVALAMVTAIDLLADMNAALDPCDATCMYMERVGQGVAEVATEVDTTFTFTTVRTGDKLEMGLTEGDLEISTSEDFSDETSHQEGTTVLERLKTGTNIEAISVVLKEATAAKLRPLLEVAGATIVEGLKEITGVGTGDNFKNASKFSKHLVLHPKRLADSDISEDWMFPKAYPRIASNAFSGEASQKITVEFQILPDRLYKAKHQHLNYGDHSINLLA